MSKIKIKTTINDEYFYCEGIKNKNNIIYKDNMKGGNLWI